MRSVNIPGGGWIGSQHLTLHCRRLIDPAFRWAVTLRIISSNFNCGGIIPCPPVCSPFSQVKVLSPALSKFQILIHIITDGNMYLCTVNVNRRVMIWTLISALWQQASKLSALWHFKLIWKDWDKCAYEYSNYFYYYYYYCCCCCCWWWWWWWWCCCCCCCYFIF